MVDGAMIPTEVWLLMFEFMPKSAYNPIVFTRLSQICRSANVAFRSDKVWQHINPYGLESDINHHFTITMTVLNPTQQLDMFFVWDFVRKLRDPQLFRPFDDTPAAELYYNLIPNLDARENDYYNLALLLCSVPLIDQPRVTTIAITNETLLKSAISLEPRVYKRLPDKLKANKELVTLMLSLDSDLIEFLPHYYRLSADQILAAIGSCGPDLNLDFVGQLEELPQFAAAMVRRSEVFIDSIPERFLKDRQFILDNIAHQGALYLYAPKELQNDPEFRRKAVLASPNVADGSMDLDLWKLAVWAHPTQYLGYAPKQFQKQLMPLSLERSTNPREWFQVHSELEGVEDLKPQAVELFNGLAHLWPEHVPTNRAKVLESIKAVRQGGDKNSVYLPREYCNDREVVMAAVSADGSILEYASDAMRNDKAIVLKALESESPVLAFVSSRLRDDKTVVKKALACSGLNLGYCSPKIKENKELVAIAVANNGEALKYASDTLRADKDLVLRARCSLKPVNEEITYEDPFYDKFAENDPYLDMVNQINRNIGLAPIENEGVKLEFFELYI